MSNPQPSSFSYRVLQIILAFMFCGLPGLAAAATASQWTGQITLYGWMAGIGGQIQPVRGAPVVSFEKSPSAVFKDINGAFFASGIARKGSIVLLGDFSYSSSSRQGLTPLGIPAQGKLTQRSLALLAGGRVLDDPGIITLDAMGGLRLWDINLSVSAPRIGVSASPGRVFVDPIVALRSNITLAPRWSLIAYGDLGGGTGSRFTYQLLGTINFQATRNLYLSAGYRRLYVDYQSGGTLFRGDLQGPIAGLTWRFF